MNTVGERIKKLRKEHDMTQEELGAILGVQKATVQKYEKGIVTNIKPDVIECLAEVFEVSPSYLMGWEELHDSRSLAKEVSVIERIHNKFGLSGVEFYKMLVTMNEEGRRKVLFYTEDIYEKYKKDDEA